jgi:glycosyltransferase involved in cell wall biosynthesis
MRAHLEARLAAMGIPGDIVEFSGPKDREELPAVYRSAAVCIVPSLYENFPYTCLEAMSCSCAVVASRVGGIPEIVTDQVDGLLVKPNDPEALAGAIVRVLSDRAERHRLRREARRSVLRRFSCRAVCEQMAALYVHLSGRRRRER